MGLWQKMYSSVSGFKHTEAKGKIYNLLTYQDVQTADIKVQVCIFAFDLLYLNGEVLFSSIIQIKGARD